MKRSSPVTYSLDLDIGEVADGYRLFVRGISLRGENLLFDCVFVPERAEGADVWPSMNYGADVSPPGWNQGGRKGRCMNGPCRRHSMYGSTSSGLTTTGSGISTAMQGPIATTTGTG